MHQINPKTLISEIKSNLKAGLNTMIWGGPGIGKSDIPQQVAKELKLNLIDFRANLFDPVDVRGIPHLTDDKSFTKWAVPDVFPIVERDGDRGLLFIDELPTAPPATQNAFLQLLLTRKIGDYTLPDGWSMIAAGNRLTDSAAVYQMPSPVRNRFSHYELEPTIETWADWAFAHNIDSSIISFLQYRPELLYKFKADEYAFPTPRSWSFVNKKITTNQDNVSDEDFFYGVSSLVGDGPAGEFVAFKQIADKLPDIDNIIAKPETYTVKKEQDPALLYALSGALASRAEDKLMANICKLIKKLPPEYQVVCIKGCLSKDKNLRTHNDVKKWIVDNAQVLL